MKLSQFFKSVDSIKQQFRSPEFAETYTNVGLQLANWAVIPFRWLLLSLLSIQGLDPNSRPGEKAHQLFLEAIGEAFNTKHAKAYDKDFHPEGWARKSFDHIKEKYPHLSENEFLKATNLNNSFDHAPKNATVYATSSVEPIAVKTPVDELASLLNGFDSNVPSSSEISEGPARGKKKDEFMNDAGHLYDLGELAGKTHSVDQLPNVLQKLGDYSVRLQKSEGLSLSQKCQDFADKLKSSDVPVSKHYPEGLSLVQQLKDKYAKAVLLAEEMIDRGLLIPEGKDNQVAEILKFDDVNFESLRKLVMETPHKLDYNLTAQSLKHILKAVVKYADKYAGAYAGAYAGKLPGYKKWSESGEFGGPFSRTKVSNKSNLFITPKK